jgi:hypothetical protein
MGIVSEHVKKCSLIGGYAFDKLSIKDAEIYARALLSNVPQIAEHTDEFLRYLSRRDGRKYIEQIRKEEFLL